MVKVFDITEDGKTEHSMGIFCDGCGCEFMDSDGYSRWHCFDVEDAKWNIVNCVRNDVDYGEYGWNYSEDGKDYCPRCAHYSSDYLDRLVVHPIPKKIQDVIDVNTKFRDSQITNDDKSNMTVTIPLELAHKIKGMLYHYALVLTKAHTEYHDVLALENDFSTDDEMKKFLAGWKSEDYLEVMKEHLENIIGNFQDCKK